MRALEGASRELRVAHGRDRVGGQVGSDGPVTTRPFRSPVVCLVAHRDLQCDSPGGRAEGEWLGFPWNPGGGGKKEGGLALGRTSWPSPSVGSGAVALLMFFPP